LPSQTPFINFTENIITKIKKKTCYLTYSPKKIKSILKEKEREKEAKSLN